VAEPFKTWQCGTCGFIYEEAVGLPEEGFPAGTRWADIPSDWVCPDCSMSKAQFEMVEV
jgi:rubredoxin